MNAVGRSARLDLFGTGEESSSVIGNPYLGVEFAAGRRLLLEAGARAPLTTADEESFADLTAALADPLRMEAFVEDVVPVYGAATVRHALSGGFGVRARAGVTGFFPTGESGSKEGALDYGLAGTYEAGKARVALGFTGRWLATVEDDPDADYTLHRAGLSADFRVGRVRPGVSLRVPLDEEMRSVVNSTVGLYLQVPVR